LPDKRIKNTNKKSLTKARTKCQNEPEQKKSRIVFNELIIKHLK
jgi:hypothetical protein